MLLGCIADDFTGAGDLANTLHKAGMRTRMVLGPISADDVLDAGDADAIVVALKSRSMPVKQAVEQSLAALHSLKNAGAVQFMFKYCSTFDSTPEGNIGPVAEALANALDATGVVVCPAFPENGRTVYQGHLFVDDKLLNETGMENHPLTPMTDPDIRRWLQKQCGSEVGHVDHSKVREGGEAIAQTLRDRAVSGCQLVVIDAICDDDLRAIGLAIKGIALFTGGSAIAIGIPENFRREGLLEVQESHAVSMPGPTLLLAGSCSRITLRQVEKYSTDHPAYAIDINALINGNDVKGEVAAFIEKHLDESPLIYSSSSAEEVTKIQKKYGRETVSETTERLFASIASAAKANGTKKIICAGGETSGVITQALNLDTLEIGPEIAPGVPTLYTVERDLALVLKSGNFGQEDFFERAVNLLENGSE